MKTWYCFFYFPVAVNIFLRPISPDMIKLSCLLYWEEIINLLILPLQWAWNVSHTLTCLALPLMSSNSSRHQNQPFYCMPVSFDDPPLKHPLSDPLDTPLVSSILQTLVYSVYQHLSSSESWAGLTQLPTQWCSGEARGKDCRSKSQDHESANC